MNLFLFFFFGSVLGSKSEWALHRSIMSADRLMCFCSIKEIYLYV